MLRMFWKLLELSFHQSKDGDFSRRKFFDLFATFSTFKKNMSRPWKFPDRARLRMQILNLKDYKTKTKKMNINIKSNQ